MPLILGTYSQRICVRHIKGEFLKLNFASCVSAVALGFAALSHECAFLTLKLSYFHFKVQLSHLYLTICIILMFPFFKL